MFISPAGEPSRQAAKFSLLYGQSWKDSLCESDTNLYFLFMETGKLIFKGGKSLSCDKNTYLATTTVKLVGTNLFCICIENVFRC